MDEFSVFPIGPVFKKFTFLRLKVYIISPLRGYIVSICIFNVLRLPFYDTPNKFVLLFIDKIIYMKIIKINSITYRRSLFTI